MRRGSLAAMLALGMAVALAASSMSLAATKLVLWHIQTTDPTLSIIDASVARFRAAHPGVEVEVVPLQNDPYKVRLAVAMGAGDPPDVFISWGGGPLEEYVKAGKVADLTPFLLKDDYIKRFPPAAMGPVTFGGRYYGVPVENVAPALIWYNRAFWSRYGVSPPSTWDEFLAVANKFKGAGVIPVALANRTKWPGSMWYMYLVDRIGGEQAFRRAVERTGSFADPPFVKAGEEIQRLVDLGVFPPGFNGIDWDTGGSRMLLYSGRAAMELMGSWQYQIVYGENPEFFEDLDYFHFPTYPGGVGDPTNLIGTPGDNYYCIAASSPNKELAFELIQYLIDDVAVSRRIAAGKIPPVAGVENQLTDPVLRRLYMDFSRANHMQLWYDQYLPPELGEVHKNTLQAVFGKTMTPLQAAQEMEAAARNYYGR
ncbi:MAG TPA: extracellular solute-binding protein [Limnochordales bacterium]